MTFPEFLTEEGFQADACQSCIHPDFYRLARSLYHRTRILERELGHANERCQKLSRRILKLTEVKPSR